MKKLCRNCASFKIVDGKSVCETMNVERTDTDNPPPDATCWNKRPKPTEGEIAKIRSQNGRKGGRPKGSGKGRTPCRQVSIHLADYSVLQSYSNMKDMTLVNTMHWLAKLLITKYPQLKPDAWVD